MASKRFFWLKLQEDFFQQKAMKKLRRMERGEALTIIYLKMQLASLRNGGVIAFEGLGDSLTEELSLQLDESENDVCATVEFLMKCGLMEQIESTDTYISIRRAGARVKELPRDMELTLQREEWEGAPAFGVYVNGEQIGNIPAEYVSYVQENFSRCEGITNIEVYGGGEGRNYGAEIILRFRKDG